MTVITIALTACATAPNAHNNTLVVDMAGNDARQYDVDLAQCNYYADKADSDVTGNAIAGAIAGALIMALVTDSSDYIGRGAGAGAAGATVGTVSQRQAAKKQIVGNCLKGRGYSVLHY